MAHRQRLSNLPMHVDQTEGKYFISTGKKYIVKYKGRDLCRENGVSIGSIYLESNEH